MAFDVVLSVHICMNLREYTRQTQSAHDTHNKFTFRQSISLQSTGLCPAYLHCSSVWETSALGFLVPLHSHKIPFQCECDTLQQCTHEEARVSLILSRIVILVNEGCYIREWKSQVGRIVRMQVRSESSMQRRPIRAMFEWYIYRYVFVWRVTAHSVNIYIFY